MGQAEVNIGLVGHVDHGKTTLTRALSGVWTDKHSEELRRGITIRLGYADIEFRKCEACEGIEAYTTEKTCPKCGGNSKVLRKVSFVDAPGHETLMATMLSGAAIMDGAILVIAANEKCPQPQTREHLMALNIVGIKNIVIAQNKIELVSKEKAIENYNQIKSFIKGTVAENAPIIPISAQHRVNIDYLIKSIEDVIKTPKRDPNKPPIMYIARSFDTNRPGTFPEDLKGGILGGSLIQGKLKVGDKIEIRPGFEKVEQNKKVFKPILTEVSSLNVSNESVEEALPGGLLGVGTFLDPAVTKSDTLAGSILGHPDELPKVWESLTLEINLLERVVGTEDEIEVDPIRPKEMLLLNVGTAKTIGTTTKVGKVTELILKLPVCSLVGERVAISRRVGARWRLIGYGIIK
ncbi:MAG: Translation initiation factor 2 subunit gamma [Candidatus Methanofastidiosum methylothiophilum]|uniref:Translation initiation factor 2 subunit gamma n=1 Tax=Candidatus Methanofastidiosum methylothiophilum TaxID=1705564 RepID=A0A150J3D7_9EURY|nr:MAG: Translation initiation factor 2 subunit gamma [Candidatus Methanofastidiosum methylthiophilus]